MILTNEMAQAFYLIENTADCMYITGKAGTGKTTFLKYIVANTKKKIAIAASTGIAAINAGGVTLHSLFNIPLAIQDPNEPMRGKIYANKVELFSSIDTLIIDEISMVRPDTIDYIDKKLRLYRLSNEPFGGMQIVMFGDLYQLSPVVTNNEKCALLQIYRGVYFFYAKVFRECGFKIIELSHVFRQSDARFVEILNNIRCYKMTNRDIEDLDALRDRRASQDYTNQYIHICAYRKDVQNINAKMLGTPTHEFHATYTGDFSKSSAPCEDVLLLRIGARVMTLANDPNHVYCNGSIGTVIGITDQSVSVRFDTGVIASVEKYTWSSKEYQMEDGKIKVVDKGSCEQFPIALAWAITIHKSQGLTFDHVTIHAKNVFCPGQLYVALSRCTSMEGIISESFIGKKYVIPDPELIAFDNACKKCGNVFDKNTYRSMNLR